MTVSQHLSFLNNIENQFYTMQPVESLWTSAVLNNHFHNTTQWFQKIGHLMIMEQRVLIMEVVKYYRDCITFLYKLYISCRRQMQMSITDWMIETNWLDAWIVIDNGIG